MIEFVSDKAASVDKPFLHITFHLKRVKTVSKRTKKNHKNPGGLVQMISILRMQAVWAPEISEVWTCSREKRKEEVEGRSVSYSR